MKALTLIQGPLTKDEEKLLGFFRQMNARCKSEALTIAEGDAKECAVGGAVPRLRLAASFGEVTA